VSRGRPPTPRETVEEALRRIDAGQHRNDVAVELTTEGRPISVATIRRAEDARKEKAQPRSPEPEPLAPPPSPPPVPPVPPVLDAVTEIDALISSTKGHQSALVGKQGYSGAGTLLVSLIKLRAAIERERSKPGAELSSLLAKGPAAVAKIRQGAAVIAAREAETGLCARCGAKIGGNP
jgi:hypothetical protein